MPRSSTRSDGQGFRADQAALEARATDLIHAMGRVLGELPDPTAVRGAGRRLSLDKTLTWKARRIAAASDLAGLLPVLPGGPGREKLLAAIASVADQDDLARLRAAFEALDEEISTRHLDAASLAAMAAGGLDSASKRRAHLRVRESATRAANRVLGTAAHLTVCTHLLVGRTDGDEVEHTCMTAHVGLHRTGPGPCLEIAVNGVLREDLSSRDAIREVVVLEPSGSMIFHGSGTSPSDSIDLTVASPRLTLSRDSSAVDVSMPIRIPSDHAVLEVWVDRSLGRPAPRGITMQAQPLDTPRGPDRPEPLRLPMSESLDVDAPVDLDESFGEARLRHAAIIDRCLDEHDRVRDDFVVHRLVVPWPVFMSNLLMFGRRNASGPEATR